MIFGKQKKTRRMIRYIKAGLIGLVIGSIFPYFKSFCEDHIRISARYDETPQQLQYYKSLVNKLSDGKLGSSNVHLGFRSKRPRMKYLVNMRGVIGSCNYVLSDLKYEIDIYSDLWDFHSSEQKLFLVAHELRHCECRYFSHVRVKFFEDGCPFSYMNDSLPSKRCLKKRLSHYLAELRKGCI